MICAFASDMTTENNLQIKPALFSEDKEKICAYYAAAWRDIFGEELKYMREAGAKARRLLHSDIRNIAFGCAGECEVGIIMLDDTAVLYPGAGHISVLYLKPEFRRMGFGIQLISHAIDKYRADGKKHISVRVAETNTAAHAFYIKHGFYEVFREIEEDVRQIVMLLDI